MLNPHFHTLGLDGVYVRGTDGALRFHPLDPPTHDDVLEVATLTHARTVRVLDRHGRCLEGIDDAPDVLGHEQPALASCYAASAGDLQLLGAHPGHRTDKHVRPVRLAASSPAPLDALAEVGGVNIHANVVVDGRDRRRLERLVRYLARPPLAQDRLERHDDGRVRYRFKKPWKDGTDAVLLDPLDFIARLCALIPPPRFHMIRYHGVLSAHAKARPEVIKGRATMPGQQLALLSVDDGGPPEPKPPARHPWPWLLRRVFAVDITACPDCGGRMRLVTLAPTSEEAAALLSGKLPRSRAPPRPRDRAAQLAFDFAAA